MGSRVFDLAGLIVVGVIVANLLLPRNNAGLKTVINGVQGIWGQSINGLLGQTG
jgi:predicted membrane chloride channel (bestrophin family)